MQELTSQEQKFIDAVYIQCTGYTKAAELLEVDLPTIREMNEDLRKYWQPVTKIRDKWNIKKVGGNFWDFYYWYITSEKKCHYCDITQAELDQLHIIGIKNKRPTRGKTLEIDRMIADEDYSNIPNLTYSCYWCNNAKTDTFTEEEFHIIGKAIGLVWQQRLSK